MAAHGCICCNKCGVGCPICGTCPCKGESMMEYFKEMETFGLPVIDKDGVHGTPVGANTLQVDFGSNYYVGDPQPESPVGNYTMTTTYPWHVCYYGQKSAREQVQDEILTKMADAIENDDLKKAKELIKLAKALKEL